MNSHQKVACNHVDEKGGSWKLFEIRYTIAADIITSLIRSQFFRHSLRGSLLRGGYNNSLHVPLAVPTPAPPLPPEPPFFLFSSTGPTPYTPSPPPAQAPPNRNTQANALATPGVNYPLVSAWIL